ncbi:hypothetical protein BLOT_014784 [Blomia tropicalis]|nr:hypothetical protein BLOT_014784 [Blomia tropicalis]
MSLHCKDILALRLFAKERLKVMRCNMESNEADNLKEDNHIDRTEQMVNTNLSLPQYVSNNVQPLIFNGSNGLTFCMLRRLRIRFIHTQNGRRSRGAMRNGSN